MALVHRGLQKRKGAPRRRWFVGRPLNRSSVESGLSAALGVRARRNRLKLADVREAYYTYTAKASDIARQLAFAGIAIVWVFSGGGGSTGAPVHVPRDLTLIGLVLVIALASDFLQYVWASGAWGILGRLREQRQRATADLLAPLWINYPTDVFFWTKLILVTLAYVLLAVALSSRLL